MRRLLRISRQPFGLPVVARGWQRAVPVLLAIGTLCVLGGLTVIWAARLTVPYAVYVSELGARGAATAGPFAVALPCRPIWPGRSSAGSPATAMSGSTSTCAARRHSSRPSG